MLHQTCASQSVGRCQWQTNRCSFLLRIGLQENHLVILRCPKRTAHFHSTSLCHQLDCRKTLHGTAIYAAPLTLSSQVSCGDFSSLPITQVPLEPSVQAKKSCAEENSLGEEMPSYTPDTPCMPYICLSGWFWGVNVGIYMAKMDCLGTGMCLPIVQQRTRKVSNVR